MNALNRMTRLSNKNRVLFKSNSKLLIVVMKIISKKEVVMKYGVQIIYFLSLVVPNLLHSMDKAEQPDTKVIIESPMIISDQHCKQSMRNYIDRIVREGQSANLNNNGLLNIYLQIKKEIDAKGILEMNHECAAFIDSALRKKRSLQRVI
jgi:hypothetical protein